jgi:aminoglycoside 6'-N-acetyltransferase I
MDHIIMEAGKEQVDSLTKLGMELWPDNEFSELKNDFLDNIESDNNKLFLYLDRGVPVAFLHVSIRVDYVEGSDSSPTGYLEGIYVQPTHRRKGISTLLFNEGKAWLKRKGCTQVGSDMEIDNQDSYPFHMSLGFKEAGRLITFIRDLD